MNNYVLLYFLTYEGFCPLSCLSPLEVQTYNHGSLTPPTGSTDLQPWVINTPHWKYRLTTMGHASDLPEASPNCSFRS